MSWEALTLISWTDDSLFVPTLLVYFRMRFEDKTLDLIETNLGHGSVLLRIIDGHVNDTFDFKLIHITILVHTAVNLLFYFNGNIFQERIHDYLFLDILLATRFTFFTNGITWIQILFLQVFHQFICFLGFTENHSTFTRTCWLLNLRRRCRWGWFINHPWWLLGVGIESWSLSKRTRLISTWITRVTITGHALHIVFVTWI